jgi:hypothetical protein
VVIQHAFPDGVVWIAVGKEPRDDIAARLREAGKALSDDPAAYDGERAAQNRYKSVIRDKAALIVLDDVWNTRDIEPFRSVPSRLGHGSYSPRAMPGSQREPAPTF